MRIGVTGQAISKWENADNQPDCFNLKMISEVYNVSLDSLLETDYYEKVVDTISIGNTVFEVIEKPKTILAGMIIFAKWQGRNFNFEDAFPEDEKKKILEKVTDCYFPEKNITASLNFWLSPAKRGMGFVKQVKTEKQTDGVNVYVCPPSLYIRAHTGRNHASLLAKESCEIWELFAYIRNYVMPKYSYKMATNGAQELEVFDSASGSSGYAYMPVEKI